MKYALNQARHARSEYVFKKIGFRNVSGSSRAPKDHSKSIYIYIAILFLNGYKILDM